MLSFAIQRAPAYAAILINTICKEMYTILFLTKNSCFIYKSVTSD